jgi:sec-independent protein translocase protein TatB
MFDIGWSEIVVIGVVALIVIGPKELPAVLRAIGQWTTKIRRMAGEFQSQFQEAMREAEMSDLKKQVDELGDSAKGLASDFDPLDFKGATKWEPKTDPKSDEPKSDEPKSDQPKSDDPKPDSDSGATPESAPAVLSSETQDAVVSAAEPAGASAPESSSGQSPAAVPPAPDVGSTSEPHPAVPLAEGSGRA